MLESRSALSRAFKNKENYSICAVAIRLLTCMQFIAMQVSCRISNPLINEQNAAALADAKVR